jgi:WD40 repeat protein
MSERREMNQIVRTFRIFVSSTFQDLKKERDALRKHVFPRLKRLCASYGSELQVVDLRWGVSEEASLDQQTMSICLDEISRCQQITPRPNFIILLGDRYGWCPPPAEIPAAELEQILDQVPLNDRRFLLDWYREDENADPAVYCLQPRERGGEFERYDAWAPIEHKLHSLLQAAATALNMEAAKRLKYEASATHQEIAAGALSVQDASEHVFAFIREVSNLPQDDRAQDYLELNDDGLPDEEKRGRLDALKRALRDQLGDNIYPVQAEWHGGKITDDHLEGLCDQVHDSLAGVIRGQLQALEDRDPLEEERLAQKAFREQETRFFAGREEYLHRIHEYLGERQRYPLIVWGVSGSGKSTLLARASRDAADADPNLVVILRHLGATADSSNGRTLLRRICEEIYRKLELEHRQQALLAELDPKKDRKKGEEIEARYAIPDGYAQLVRCFSRFLSMADPGKGLVIFLDALDQIPHRDPFRDLHWLPEELPPNVWLVLSTLPSAGLEKLKSAQPASKLLELGPMKEAAAHQVLDAWLGHAHRKLQPAQRDYVLDRFRDCPHPLFLRLAFEQAKRWKSFTPEHEIQLKRDVPGLIRGMLDRLSGERHHGEVLVKRSLGYLAASKNGLSEHEILELLSMDEEVMDDFRARSPESPQAGSLPFIVWSRFFHDMAPYLSVRLADGARLIRFFHSQLEEVVRRDYLFGQERITRHRMLSRYFQSQDLTLQADGASHPNLRKLSELPYQQTMGRLWDRVDGTLSDAEFIYTKLTAAGVHALDDDYDLSLRQGNPSESLPLIQRALRLSAHVLADHPSEFPSQLTGRLLESYHPEIADFLARVRDQWSLPWIRPCTASLVTVDDPIERTLTGHTEDILAQVMTHDGRYVITGSKDMSIRIWDLQTGEMHHGWKGSRTPIRALALASDDSILLSGDEGGKIRGWDLRARIRQRKLGKPLFVLLGHEARVTTLSLTPDNQHLLSGSADNTLRLWDLAARESSLQIQGHAGDITAALIAPEGSRAFSGAKDRTIRVWDLATGACVQTLEGHTETVHSMAPIPGTARILSASLDGTLRVWDLEKASQVALISGLEGPAGDLAVTMQGKYCISASPRWLQVWSLEDYRERARVENHWGGSFVRVSVTRDSRRLVTAMSDYTVRVWDFKRCMDGGKTQPSRTEARISHPFSGRYGFFIQEDGTLGVKDLQSGELNTTGQPADAVVSANSSPSGGSILFSHRGGSLRCFTAAEATLRQVPHPEGCGAVCVALTSDEQYAVLGCQDGNLRVLDLNSGKILRVMGGHKGMIRQIMVTPDGRHVITAAEDKTIKSWDLEKGMLLRTLKDAGWPFVTFADGRTLAARSRDRSLDQSIKVMDYITGKLIRRIEGHRSGTFTIHLEGVLPLYDSRHLISWSDDKTIRLWDTKDGRLVAMFTGEAGFRSCAWAANDLTLHAAYDTDIAHRFRLENIKLGPIAITPRDGRAVCPHCLAPVSVSAEELGAQMDCPACGGPLKVGEHPIHSIPREDMQKPPKSPPRNKEKKGMPLDQFLGAQKRLDAGAPLGPKRLTRADIDRMIRKRNRGKK